LFPLKVTLVRETPPICAVVLSLLLKASPSVALLWKVVSDTVNPATLCEAVRSPFAPLLEKLEF
jgi:hypothetical protein